MSAGVRQSASRDFEGLEIEHDAKQISFPGYKVSSKIIHNITDMLVIL